MEQKNIALDFIGKYDARLKYKFITEELFEVLADDIQIPGFIAHFIYEEYHPNHSSDIEKRSTNFITGWFNKKIDEYNSELGDSFILTNETILSKNEVLEKIQKVFDSYLSFSNTSYAIYDISFKLQDENQTGTGYAKGDVSYDAILENGEKVHVEGPFQFYLTLEYQCWCIFYFVFPGFKWD